MFLSNILLLFLIVLVLNCSYGQKNIKFFRKDYIYLEDTQSFYKMHTLRKTWEQAKRICLLEGTILFYPEHHLEAHAIITWWNLTHPFKFIYIGVSDLVAKGVFATIDGKMISDVYNNWAPGEPNDADGEEDCVIFRRDTSTLNDDRCNIRLPFICKKKLDSLQWNTECNFPYLDYQHSKGFRKCYKLHLTPLTWPEALAICVAEQSTLAVPENSLQKDILVNLTQTIPQPKIALNDCRAVHMGYHNRVGDGWQSVTGSTLNSSIIKFISQKMDGNEVCGSMLYDGSYKRIICNATCNFICEHEINYKTNYFPST